MGGGVKTHWDFPNKLNKELKETKHSPPAEGEKRNKSGQRDFSQPGSVKDIWQAEKFFLSMA